MRVDRNRIFSGIPNHGFYQADKASKWKAKFLKPDDIPEAPLESDSEESENDNSEKDNEQLGTDQSLFQQVQAHSHRMAIQCSSADTTGTSHLLLSPQKKMNKINQINRHYNSKQVHGGCYPTL
jgi:hypothetical protein